MKKYILLAIFVVFTVGALCYILSSLSVAAPRVVPNKQEQECPEGYFWRGACMKVTGCPYGDSIPISKCKKFEPKPVKPVMYPRGYFGQGK